jgi:hypothetical protein
VKCYAIQAGVSAVDPNPTTSEFPASLKDFKWDSAKLIQKLKSKVNFH